MPPRLLPGERVAHAWAIEPIVTPRLMLRPVGVDDISAAYLDGLNDPDVVRWTEARHVVWTRERAAEWIERSNVPGVSLLLGWFVRGSGKHIGNIRLFNMHPLHRRAELSLIVFDKTEWSKGYATEAVTAVTAYAFATLALHRIHADYYAGNAASARVFAKAGYEIEGVYRDHVVVDGAYMDSIRAAKLNR